MLFQIITLIYKILLLSSLKRNSSFPFCSSLCNVWHELVTENQCSRVYNVICHSGEDLWTPLERDTYCTRWFMLADLFRCPGSRLFLSATNNTAHPSFQTRLYEVMFSKLGKRCLPSCSSILNVGYVITNIRVNCYRIVFIGWTSILSPKHKGAFNNMSSEIWFLFLSCCRSIHRLSQLERLDLGSNEFSELVRKMFSYWTLLSMGQLLPHSVFTQHGFWLKRE